MRVAKDTLLDGYAADTGFVTAPFSIKHMTGFVLVAHFRGGSPSGTIEVQTCTTWDEEDIQEDEWTTVTAPTTTVKTVSGSGNHKWNLSNQYDVWVRLKYTRTSGTSDVTVKASAKGE